MHALHIGARPEALPCRVEEYGRVMRAVEELLKEGSGGCICELFASLSVLSDQSISDELNICPPQISRVSQVRERATVHAVVRELKRMTGQNVYFSRTFESE